MILLQGFFRCICGKLHTADVMQFTCTCNTEHRLHFNEPAKRTWVDVKAPSVNPLGLR